ncbi:MAG: Caulobacter phage CcrPW [Pseudomonadota bacterium]
MKAISLDFWGTLCVSNPQFRENQFKLLRQFDHSITFDYWLSQKIYYKKLADVEAETRGGQLDRLSLNKHIFPHWQTKDIEEFMLLSDDMFVQYPPFNYLSPSFIDIARQAGYTLYISSNTVFTSGAALSRVIFDKFAIPKNHCKFSDEIGKAKIDASMFDFEIKPTFHIGDNPKTDGASERYGITFLDVQKLSLTELINAITHD